MTPTLANIPFPTNCLSPASGVATIPNFGIALEPGIYDLFGYLLVDSATDDSNLIVMPNFAAVVQGALTDPAAAVVTTLGASGGNAGFFGIGGGGQVPQNGDLNTLSAIQLSPAFTGDKLSGYFCGREQVTTAGLFTLALGLANSSGVTDAKIAKAFLLAIVSGPLPT